MEYTQLPFKFIMYNSDRIVRQNLFLSTKDYSCFIAEFGNVIRPYPGPDYGVDNYSSLHEIWILKCLKNEKYRSLLRNELIIELKHIVNEFAETKLEPTTIDYYSQNIYDYNFYHKELIDVWIEIWNSVEIEIESLETLLLFKKFLERSCLNKIALELDLGKRKKLWSDSASDSREEKSYWNNNSYEEGGGGQDWSDSF
jgi:hypothetical protein